MISIKSRKRQMRDQKDVSTWERTLGWITIVAITVYLTWRVLFSLPFSYGPLAITLGVVFYICEFISGIQAIANYLGMIRPLPLERPEIPESWYPHVDIMIATHDEEVNLLYNTVNACLYLDYPDKSKIHIHLCDDTNRPGMRKLAEDLGVNYITMDKPIHAKAGNMNNALKQTYAPFIAFLDADMIPRREFIMRIIPYFFLPRVKKNDDGVWVPREEHEIDPNYKVGFVQTPQNFYNPDLFQYNLYAEERVPNEQIYFFREVNLGRNRTNSAHLCGSNMIMARAAMEEIGYFPVNNITEDHETGILIQNGGWTTYAIGDCLANGLNPNGVVNFIVQRERWGRGCMQTMYNLKPFFNSKIPWARRFSYMCTLLYWLTFFCRFMYVICPIIVTLFNVFIVECSLGELLMFWLPSSLLHSYSMKRLSSKTRTVHWNNTFDVVQFPFLVVPIMLDAVGIRLKKFKVTKKGHQYDTSHPRLALPHIFLFIFSAISIVLCLINIIHYRSFYQFIILFWLVINSISLVMAIFFMLGRTNERFTYRFKVAVPIEVEYRGFIYKGMTVDFSEGGLSATLDFPAWFDAQTPLKVRITDRIYVCEMQCQIVQVNRNKDGQWAYSFKQTEIDSHNLSQYRQIIYDRDPTLPEAMNESMPVIEDLRVNFDKRIDSGVKFFSRKLPRIPNAITGTLPDGTTVTLEDFSYHYVKASPMPPLAGDEVAIVTVEPGVVLKLGAPEEHLAAQRRELFQVLNSDEWADNPKYMEVIARWAESEMPQRVSAKGHSEPADDVPTFGMPTPVGA